MQIYETSFGNGQSIDYETCRFVYTSMNRVLAMLKAWNQKIVFVLHPMCSMGTSQCALLATQLTDLRKPIADRVRCSPLPMMEPIPAVSKEPLSWCRLGAPGSVPVGAQ